MQGLTAAFRSLSSTVSGLINISPIINEACEDSSTATPGYLYKQIADMTFESTDTCMKILELLVAKMEDPSAVVKYKALNVVKNVLQKGSAAFFQEMGRKHQTIRECLNFRGAPDPLRGDAPYSQVRELAQQVINMIYDTQPTFADSTLHQQNSINGHVNNNPYALGAANASRGSFEPATQTPPPHTSLSSISSHPQGPYSSHTTSQPSSNYRVSTTYASNADGSRRVYVNSPKAIGSYVEYQPTRFETMMDKVSESIDQLKTTLAGPQQNHTPSYAYAAGHSTSTAPNLTYASRYTTADAASLDYNGDVDVSRWTTRHETAAPNHIQGLSRPTQEILDGWEYKLVSELTPHTGRPAPARNDISSFVTKAAQLASSGSLAPLIEALIVRIIVPDQWQCKLKALHLIEAILRSDTQTARQLLQPHLTTLCQVSQIAIQSAIQEKIGAILQLYPESERPAMENALASSTTDNAQNGQKIGSNQEHQIHRANGHPEEGDGLFSGLTDRTTSEIPSLIDDDFSFLSGGNVNGSRSGGHEGSAARSMPMSGHVQHPHPSVLVSPASPSSILLESTSDSQSSLFEGLNTQNTPTANSASPSMAGQDLLLDFLHPTPVISTPNLPSISEQATSIERDFFSRPVSSTSIVSDPTATLRELQPTAYTATGIDRSTLTTGRDDLDQLAILRGRLLAVEDQLRLVRMQMPSPTRSELEQQLEAQHKAFEAQLKRSGESQISSSQTSLEALYRQQSTQPTSTFVDYSALQTSHPADPFDAIRHDIRR